MKYHRIVCRCGEFTTLPAVKWCEENFGLGARHDYAGRLVKIKALPWYNSGFWFYFKEEADATLFALKWG